MVLILLFVGHRTSDFKRLLIFWIVIQIFFLQAYYSVAFALGMLLCHLHQKNALFNHIISKWPIRLLFLVIGIYFASYPFVGYEKSTVNSMYAPISFFEKYPHIISYLVGDFFLFCFLLHATRLKNLLSTSVFRFFVYSNLFIGVCALLMVNQTYDLVLHSPPDKYLMGFIFSATICSYSFHWYLTSGSLVESPRVEWLKQHKAFHLALFFIGIVGSVIFFLCLLCLFVATPLTSWPSASSGARRRRPTCSGRSCTSRRRP